MVLGLFLAVMQKPRMKPDQPIPHYHVMSRTAQKSFLLEDDAFKEKVARIIDTFAKIYYVEVKGWTTMSNHVHLGLKVMKPQLDAADLEQRFNLLQAQLKRPRKWRKWHERQYYRRFTDLSKFMWEINRRIALAYNRAHGTWGHFWGARFKSKVIEDEESLLKVLSYIELNPVRAGLAEKPSDYAHCSAGRMRRDLERGKPLRGPDIAWFANLLEEDRAPAYIAYNDYLAYLIHHPEKATVPAPSKLIVSQFGKKDLKEICADLRAGTPSDWATPGYGSPAFMREMRVEQKAGNTSFKYRNGPAPPG